MYDLPREELDKERKLRMWLRSAAQPLRWAVRASLASLRSLQRAKAAALA
jgi:hypothetical protein